MGRHACTRALHLVAALSLLAGLFGCANPFAPFIWGIDPNAAPVRESVRIVATGWYVGFYGSTIDFNGAAVLDPGFPFSAWQQVQGPLGRLGFVEITVVVPDGAQGGCVTVTETFLNVPSPCYPFTVLEE